MQKITRGKHSSLKLAYTGGWIDGEGSIYINKAKNKRSGSYQYILCVSTSNTDKGIIDWFKKEYKGFTTALGYKVRNNPNHRLAYQWFSTTKTAYKFLKLILPYLKVKRRQAELAIKFQERKTKERGERKGKKLLKIQNDWRERYSQKMRKLNFSRYYLQPQRLNEETAKADVIV